MGIKSSSQYRTLDALDGEPMEFEWNIFPGFTTLQLCNKVREFLSNMSTENISLDGLSSCRCSNDISWRSEDNEKECESSAQLVSLSVRNAQHVSLFAKIFGAGQWSFFGLGSEKKWYSTGEDSPQGEWDRIAEQMMLTFAESKHSVFRSTSPLSRRVQGVGVTKARVQQAAADSRGSRTCVSGSGGTRRGGRRMN